MPPQQQQQNDNSLGPLWIVLGLFFAAALIWYFLHTYIVLGILHVRIFESGLIGLINPDFAALKKELIHTTASQVTFKQVEAISAVVGNYLRYPITVILIILAVVMYYNNSVMKYRKVYSMQRLLETENENWPAISPIIKLNLIDEDIEKGPWAMAMTPMDFCKKYKLLAEESDGPDAVVFDRSKKETATLLKGEAERILSMQIGPEWQGIDVLPIHYKALLAAFAARANGHRKDCDDLLEQIARSSKDGKLNFSGAEALLRKECNTKPIQTIFARHAYVYCVMASMIELARVDGVFASADFLWLKPLDRRLWFTLNSVGRQTAVIEVGGIFAHWLAEKELGRPLNTPMIEQAIIGIEATLAEVIYHPDDE